MEATESSDWNYTSGAKQDLSRSPYYERPTRKAPHGKYMERPIMGRDTGINGFIDVLPGMAAAVVVDDKRQPELIDAYKQLLLKTKERTSIGMDLKDGILRDVLDVARDLIPYDKNFTEGIDQQYKDQKLALAFYINRGGVCRQQALLAGYLLEKLKREKLVKGTASIQRNQVGDSAHEWVRYVNSIGEASIVDPAGNFVGTDQENPWPSSPPPKKTKTFQG